MKYIVIFVLLCTSVIQPSSCCIMMPIISATHGISCISGAMGTLIYKYHREQNKQELPPDLKTLIGLSMMSACVAAGCSNPLCSLITSHHNTVSNVCAIHATILTQVYYCRQLDNEP